MRGRIERLKRIVERHGAKSALFALSLKGVNALVVLKILRGLYIAEPPAAFLKCPAHYTAGFLPPGELRRYADDPRSEMSHEFLDKALARGDECYVIRDAERLAAYGWYAFDRTPIGYADLEMAFSRNYVYQYKGFTDSRYRGQRLHAIGMTRALAHYLGRGLRGLVAYVEADNFDSLKSCFRMGYQEFGSIYVLGLLDRWLAFPTAGCGRFEFRLEHSMPPGRMFDFRKNPN